MKRNYRVEKEVFTQVTDANGNVSYVPEKIVSFETEDVDPAQFIKGLFTDKAITKNEDGSKKEDHTMRNVIIGLGLAGAAYYMYNNQKGENQTAAPQIPNYQPQPVYQIPQQSAPQYQSYQVSQPTAPAVEYAETPVDSNSEVQITEF